MVTREPGCATALTTTDNSYRAAKVTPLMIAAVNNRADVVRFLLEEAHVPPQDEDGSLGLYHQPALHLACVFGWTEVVALLLAHGADVHQVEHPLARTPLQNAAASGYAAIARLLLTAGKYDEQRLIWALESAAGWQAEHWHISRTRHSWRAWLSGSSHTPTDVQDFAGTMRLIADAGVDLSNEDVAGPLLAAACRALHVAGVSTLLELGAAANARDMNGKMPLHHACGFQNDTQQVNLMAVGRILEILTDHGAELCASWQGVTPIACMRESVKSLGIPVAAQEQVSSTLLRSALRSAAWCRRAPLAALRRQLLEALPD